MNPQEAVGHFEKHLEANGRSPHTTRAYHGEWQTRCQGKTDAAGTLVFSGFYGTYHVRLGSNGVTTESQFHLEKGGQNRFMIER